MNNEKPEKDYTIEDLKNMGTSSKVTDEVIRKLEEAFGWDFTDEEAADHAGISPRSYYNYYKMSSEFAEKMDRAKRLIFTIAKKNIQNAVRHEQSDPENGTENSWKLLERRQKHLYANRNEVTGADGKELDSGVNALQDIAMNLKNLMKNDGPNTADSNQTANSQGSDSEPVQE